MEITSMSKTLADVNVAHNFRFFLCAMACPSKKIAKTPKSNQKTTIEGKAAYEQTPISKESNMKQNQENQNMTETQLIQESNMNTNEECRCKLCNKVLAKRGKTFIEIVIKGIYRYSVYGNVTTTCPLCQTVNIFEL